MLRIPLSILNLPFSLTAPIPNYLNPSAQDHLSILPQELIERILDYLQTSRPSLLACALTSPALLAGARHHLFHDATLDSPRRVYTLCKRLPNAPAALAHVHDLRVRLPASPWSDTPEPAWYEDLDLPTLSGLHTLRLENIRGASFRGPRLCTWARVGEGVRRLMLASSVFEEAKDMRCLLATFPALEDLSFDGWFPEDGGKMNKDKEPPVKLRLRNLTLPAAGTRGAQNFLRWLSAEEHTKTQIRDLHTLTLHEAPEQTVLDAFFAQTSIQDLRVVISSRFPESHPDLSLLPSLRTFTLSLPASLEITPFLVSLLGPLHDAPVLQRVHIEITTTSSDATASLSDFVIAPLALALAPSGSRISGKADITLAVLIRWHPDPTPPLVLRTSADMPYMGGRKYAMRTPVTVGAVPKAFGRAWMEGMKDAVVRTGGVQVELGWEVVGKGGGIHWV